MNTIWNWLRGAFAAIGAGLGYFLGGCDGFLYALIAFVAIDYVTGVMCAIVDKKLSSSVGFKGIFRKVLIFVMVGIGHTLDEHLPAALAAAEKQADAFGEAFAKAHLNDKLHYFVGAGTLYGATYSYAMCYWEEMHWMRTKSIHAAEFFHGMLEIVDRDTAVTVFVGEDSQRELGQRVARFLPKVCDNFTVIDTRSFDLPGIPDAYRGDLCHLVMHAVTNRIDAHLEALSGHDMKLRRYYRQMEY